MKRLRRSARKQEALRQSHAAVARSVRVTVERRQGSTVTSAISGTGPDLAAALWNARGRASNLTQEIGNFLERFLPNETGTA